MGDEHSPVQNLQDLVSIVSFYGILPWDLRGTVAVRAPSRSEFVLRTSDGAATAAQTARQLWSVSRQVACVFLQAEYVMDARECHLGLQTGYVCLRHATACGKGLT